MLPPPRSRAHAAEPSASPLTPSIPLARPSPEHDQRPPPARAAASLAWRSRRPAVSRSRLVVVIVHEL
ncbi:hypothetical protein ACP70R_021576 [Stipagrostis hirtigluma subsp. patula]